MYQQKDGLIDRCIQILNDHRNILLEYFVDIDFLKSNDFQSAFVPVYLQPEALPFFIANEPALLLDILPNIDQSLLHSSSVEDALEIVENHLDGNDYVEGKINGVRAQTSFREMKSNLKAPSYFNKIDAANKSDETLSLVSRKLADFSFLQPFSYIHRFPQDVQPAEDLKFQSFQITSPGCVTRFHEDQLDSVIASIHGFKLWLFATKSAWEWPWTEKEEKMSMEELLKEGVRWCLIPPGSSLHVPKHRAHFVLNLSACYFGVACYYLPLNEAKDLVSSLNSIKDKADTELPVEYACVLQNLQKLFEIDKAM